MMKIVGYIAASIAAIVLIASLMFGLTWAGIEWRGFFGPKRANVERQIFEQTKSYTHGKIQDLSRYRLEYMRSDDASERQAIASTVRMQFAEFDIESLPQAELREFWRVCNNGSTE